MFASRDADVLSDEQRNWIDTASEKILRLMQETPSNGERFAKSIQHIVQREEQWNLWKNDGCKPFKKSKEQENDGKYMWIDKPVAFYLIHVNAILL